MFKNAVMGPFGLVFDEVVHRKTGRDVRTRKYFPEISAWSLPRRHRQTLDSSDTGMQLCRLQVQLEQCWVRREDSLLLKLKAGVDRKPGEALRKCTVALAEWRPCMCVD